MTPHSLFNKLNTVGLYTILHSHLFTLQIIHPNFARTFLCWINSYDWLLESALFRNLSTVLSIWNVNYINYVYYELLLILVNICQSHRHRLNYRIFEIEMFLCSNIILFFFFKSLVRLERWWLISVAVGNSEIVYSSIKPWYSPPSKIFPFFSITYSRCMYCSHYINTVFNFLFLWMPSNTEC